MITMRNTTLNSEDMVVSNFACALLPVPKQTLVEWTSVGRATTASVNLSKYAIKDGNQLTFQVRATDPAGNVGKGSKSTPIVVDTTAPVPGAFTRISVIGVSDGKEQSLHTGNGACLSHERWIIFALLTCAVTRIRLTLG